MAETSDIVVANPVITPATPPPNPVLNATQPKWTFTHTFSIPLILVATALAGWFIPSRLVSWLITIVLLMLLISIAANGVTGKWRGALIDERNRISLSRLQMLLWTILILSSILTAILTNLRANVQVLEIRSTTVTASVNTLFSVSIPPGLWVLMGIATTSLVGAPLILSTKTSRPADATETKDTLQQLEKQSIDVSNVVNNGQVLAYASAENARWADLFTGEETGNAAQFDLAKIQMFYFTFILILVYGMALGVLFQSDAPLIRAFPDMDSGMLTLLGISHAGYLLNKAVPHSSQN